MRRTPALTRRARDLFEQAVHEGGWTPGETIPQVAEATGLTKEQVRDAIFAPSADEWRRALVVRREGVN